MRFAIFSSPVLLFVFSIAGVCSATDPVGLRECWYLPAGTDADAYAANVDALASELRTQTNTTTVTQNMGLAVFQYQNSSGTCAEIYIKNWSCDHNLTVTGPGLANAAESIYDQCLTKMNSGSGFGYYQDPDTGYDYTTHLWAVVRPCDNYYLKSACYPGA